MSESKFRRDMIKFLSVHFRVHMIENKLVTGMPDLLVIRKEKEPVWIELKIGNNPLLSSQVRWIRKNPKEKVLIATLRKDKMSLQNASVFFWEEHRGLWEAGPDIPSGFIIVHIINRQ